MNNEEENITVVVRSRPLNEKERKAKDVACVARANEGKEVQIRVNPREAQAFRCDSMMMGETSQSEFFERSGIVRLLDSAMGGYRSCVFAYGQTGAGKTHTLIGESSTIQMGAEGSGIMARSFEYIFGKLQAMGIRYTIKLACMEIYQEQLFDLLANERDRCPLAVREHQTDGFFVEGCKLSPCKSAEEAVTALNKALRSRQVGAHQMNHRSNRSHFLTELLLELPAKELLQVKDTRDIPGFDTLAEHMDADREYNLLGRITFVDLAGSERLKDTKSEGKAVQEAGNINKSLYVLGKVISGMARQNGAQSHRDVPYRDSKLTKLLIHSLGGNSRTMMISCISSASSAIPETLRTLHFSMSAARIRNRPMRFMDPVERLILELREEIKRLKHENRVLKHNLASAPNTASVSVSSERGLRGSKSRLGLELQRAIAQSGATASEDYDDIVYNTPDKPEEAKPRQRRVISNNSHVVTRSKPARRKPKNIVDELKKYDMNGRPRQAGKKKPRKASGEGTSAKPKQDAPRLVDKKTRHSSSVPVIKIRNSDSHMPAATGIKKNAKSPFLAHLEKKQPSKKKSAMHRNRSDPSYLPPVNLSQEDAEFGDEPEARNRQNRNRLPHGQSSAGQKKTVLPDLSNAKAARMGGARGGKPDKQLDDNNSSRSRRDNHTTAATSTHHTSTASKSKPAQLPKRPHSPVHKAANTPNQLMANDSRGIISSSDVNSTEMAISRNLESVKEKLSRMEQQLSIKRKDVEDHRATPADRARLEALEEEVRDMQLEVQISSQLQGIQFSSKNLSKDNNDVSQKPNRQPEPVVDNSDTTGDLRSQDSPTTHSTPSPKSESPHPPASAGGTEEYEDEYDQYDDDFVEDVDKDLLTSTHDKKEAPAVLPSPVVEDQSVPSPRKEPQVEIFSSPSAVGDQNEKYPDFEEAKGDNDIDAAHNDGRLKQKTSVSAFGQGTASVKVEENDDDPYSLDFLERTVKADKQSKREDSSDALLDPSSPPSSGVRGPRAEPSCVQQKKSEDEKEDYEDEEFDELDDYGDDDFEPDWN